MLQFGAVLAERNRREGAIVGLCQYMSLTRTLSDLQSITGLIE